MASKNLNQNNDRGQPGDWIALSRRVREHPVVGLSNPVKADNPEFGSHSRFEAWFDLLCLAQYKPARVDNKGQMTTLDVGQLMGSRSFLAKRWNWTEKTVRGFLDRLEAEGMISRDQNGEKTGQQNGHSRSNTCNVLTISNYRHYQLLQDAVTRYVAESKRASEGPAKGHNLTLKHSSTKLASQPRDVRAGGSSPSRQAMTALDVFAALAEQRPTWVPPAGDAILRAAFALDDCIDRLGSGDLDEGLRRYCHAARVAENDNLLMGRKAPPRGRAKSYETHPQSIAEYAEGLLAKYPPPVATQFAFDDAAWDAAVRSIIDRGIAWPSTMGGAPHSGYCFVPHHIHVKWRLAERFSKDGCGQRVAAPIYSADDDAEEVRRPYADFDVALSGPIHPGVETRQ